MKKRLILIVLLMILVFSGCTIDNTEKNLDSELYDSETNNIEYKQKDYLSVYNLLNKPLLYNSLDSIGLTEQEISWCSEDIKEPFKETVNVGSIFPSELIGMFEKVLYDYKYQDNEWGFSDSYIQTVQNLNADSCKASLEDLYLLFPEINVHKNKIMDISNAYKFIRNPQNCYNVFHLPVETDEDYYAIEYQSGGTNGACSVQLVKLLDNKQVVINEFEIQNYGAGEVIQYGNDFYYVFIQYNYNLKTDDGIRIHKLGAHADTENILIRYLPEKYFWKNNYEAQMDYKSDLEKYINNIKSLITSKYLDNGSGEISLFNGDEVKDTNKFSVKSGANEYCKIDFANLGIPAYLTKGLIFPDTNHSSLYLLSEFYIQDLKSDSFVELDSLRLDQETSKELTLVQLWFKDINKQIFTFQVYHISSYNYVLYVSLIEGDKVTPVRTDILLAQKKFVIIEGEKFVAY